jgi:hypothetical protein
MLITVTYLEKLYDDLLRQQQDVLSSLKNLKVEDDKEYYKRETNLQKQITLITQLLTSILKFKKLQKEFNL